MVVFTNSSVANNIDSTTQLVFIRLLTDETDRANLQHYCSFKSKLIDRSVIGCETYPFSDVFDASYMILYGLQDMFQRLIPMTILTDSDSLFRVTTKASVTTEKRFLIYVRAARETYQRGDITYVGWVRSAQNLADSLTQIEKSQLMGAFLDTARIHTVVEQLVIRAEVMGDDRTEDDDDSASD